MNADAARGVPQDSELSMFFQTKAGYVLGFLGLVWSNVAARVPQLSNGQLATFATVTIPLIASGVLLFIQRRNNIRLENLKAKNAEDAMVRKSMYEEAAAERQRQFDEWRIREEEESRVRVRKTAELEAYEKAHKISMTRKLEDANDTIADQKGQIERLREEIHRVRQELATLSMSGTADRESREHFGQRQQEEISRLSKDLDISRRECVRLMLENDRLRSVPIVVPLPVPPPDAPARLQPSSNGAESARQAPRGEQSSSPPA